MSAKVILFILALFALCSPIMAQQRETKFLLDPFSPNTDPLVVTIATTTVFPVILSGSTSDSGIIGGERDLQLTAESGPVGRTLSTSVSAGQWEVSTPNSGRGFALMQYDGQDANIALNAVGLGGLNFKQNGGDAFLCSIESDIDTIYSFAVTDLNGVTGQADLQITGGAGLIEFNLLFSDFDSNVDFTKVGSVEVLIEAFDNVDTFVDFIGVTGPILDNPSPSPRPNDDWYTFDDDDNGVSPCTTNEKRRTYFLSDDKLIYYYFYGAFEGTAGFEDDFDARSANSSPILIVSFVLSIIAAFVAL